MYQSMKCRIDRQRMKPDDKQEVSQKLKCVEIADTEGEEREKNAETMFKQHRDFNSYFKTFCCMRVRKKKHLTPHNLKFNLFEVVQDE